MPDPQVMYLERDGWKRGEKDVGGDVEVYSEAQHRFPGTKMVLSVHALIGCGAVPQVEA